VAEVYACRTAALLELRSAEPVRRAFNAASDSIRVIVLLSPT
jgi:hypothetical protein